MQQNASGQSKKDLSKFLGLNDTSTSMLSSTTSPVKLRACERKQRRRHSTSRHSFAFMDNLKSSRIFKSKRCESVKLEGANNDKKLRRNLLIDLSLDDSGIVDKSSRTSSFSSVKSSTSTTSSAITSSSSESEDNFPAFSDDGPTSFPRFSDASNCGFLDGSTASSNHHPLGLPLIPFQYPLADESVLQQPTNYSRKTGFEIFSDYCYMDMSHARKRRHHSLSISSTNSSSHSSADYVDGDNIYVEMKRDVSDYITRSMVI